MSELQTELSFITPDLLSGEKEVKAWFTLKNPEYGKQGHIIPGLNLGFNTPEKREFVAKNRLKLLSTLQLDPKWVAYADQVHSNRIQVVTEGGTYPSTDGLITPIPGLTLAIQVADCAAVLLWDSENVIVAALHAGWRGAAGNIIPRGIEKMIEQGANPLTMKAFVSPCISLKNFEVGQEVADQFPREFVDFHNYDKPHIDLKGFLKHQMMEEGIPDSHIEIRDECTIEEAENFYSYRREGDQSGRMLALIQIVE
jgi:YfiH family protein